LNSPALSIIFTAIVGLFLGAYTPTWIILVVIYVRQWWKEGKRSILRLIGGILLRIYAPIFVLAIPLFLASASGIDLDKVMESNDPILIASLNVGLFGTLALFVVAYFRGRRERPQMRPNNT